MEEEDNEEKGCKEREDRKTNRRTELVRKKLIWRDRGKGRQGGMRRKKKKNNRKEGNVEKRWKRKN